jgi:hypothetical protein
VRLTTSMHGKSIEGKCGVERKSARNLLESKGLQKQMVDCGKPRHLFIRRLLLD